MLNFILGFVVGFLCVAVLIFNRPIRWFIGDAILCVQALYVKAYERWFYKPEPLPPELVEEVRKFHGFSTTEEAEAYIRTGRHWKKD